MDFDPHSQSYLSKFEFNWEDQGFYILKEVIESKIEVINKEIEYALDLTSQTIGGGQKIIDTIHFRNAIRCYVELLFGIYNEDYDYSKTNKLLEISHKHFIKNAVCFPNKVNNDDIIILRVNFSFAEIFHLVYLVSTIKQKVQLTFLSKALNDINNVID
jgi:hypothetical protein